MRIYEISVLLKLKVILNGVQDHNVLSCSLEKADVLWGRHCKTSYNHITDHYSGNEHVWSAPLSPLRAMTTLAAAWTIKHGSHYLAFLHNVAERETAILVRRMTKLKTQECCNIVFFRRVYVQCSDGPIHIWRLLGELSSDARIRYPHRRPVHGGMILGSNWVCDKYISSSYRW